MAEDGGGGGKVGRLKGMKEEEERLEKLLVFHLDTKPKADGDSPIICKQPSLNYHQVGNLSPFKRICWIECGLAKKEVEGYLLFSTEPQDEKEMREGTAPAHKAAATKTKYTPFFSFPPNQTVVCQTEEKEGKRQFSFMLINCFGLKNINQFLSKVHILLCIFYLPGLEKKVTFHPLKIANTSKGSCKRGGGNSLSPSDYNGTLWCFHRNIEYILSWMYME